ncbi:hypothetical protein GCM10010345_44020 [Streptomyces canarius]|uniref:Uncharacterized protein n=1 Tax=Streptomyces canarius TaxID=285453 RepID=A0ABQ3CU83_9ACTN|nr:hypothetical protein GCM10010345_44020 [Streptomyces canarius]
MRDMPFPDDSEDERGECRHGYVLGTSATPGGTADGSVRGGAAHPRTHSTAHKPTTRTEPKARYLPWT